MAIFKHGSASKSNQKKLIAIGFLAVIVGLVLVSQSERFWTQGTFFGYKVRNVSTSTAAKNRNNSGAVFGARPAKNSKPSIACQTFPEDKVSKIVDAKVERLVGFTADKTKPLLMSSCIYKVNGESKSPTSISILIRENKDDAAAEKTLGILKAGGKDSQSISELGDEAYFNKTSNQLTVRNGKKLTTITVIGTGTKDSKNTAIDIAKISQ